MNNPRVSSESISDALFDALTDGGDASLQKLALRIREYQAKYGRTYAQIRRQPFARNLIDAILEAAEYNDPQAIDEQVTP